MGNVRARTQDGKLFFDFRYEGRRCREYTALPDTPANRKKMARVLERIEQAIASGQFNYTEHFPASPHAARFSAAMSSGSVPGPAAATKTATPLFSEFAEQWVRECEIGWRRSYKRTIADMLEGRLKPAFGSIRVGHITKAAILSFRSELGKVPGRKGQSLSPKRINTLLGVLRQILDEAADRHDFISPCRNIKRLKAPRSHVQPFSLAEVGQILATVRTDFRAYYTVRFFTGMRTGEIDGLKWKYVDFDRRVIQVRETRVNGEDDYTKTEESQRDIQMSGQVFAALKAQEAVTGGRSVYVFCNHAGLPLDHNNVSKRVWYPLLRHLGLAPRRPYETRHTAATLWLAAGENPLWIARQLGHASTEMLFRVYAGFVPNLTRQDGSAFERLLAGSLVIVPGSSPHA